MPARPSVGRTMIWQDTDQTDLVVGLRWTMHGDVSRRTRTTSMRTNLVPRVGLVVVVEPIHARGRRPWSRGRRRGRWREEDRRTFAWTVPQRKARRGTRVLSKYVDARARASLADRVPEQRPSAPSPLSAREYSPLFLYPISFCRPLSFPGTPGRGASCRASLFFLWRSGCS